MARVNHDAQDALGVTKRHASQKDVVVREGDHLGLVILVDNEMLIRACMVDLHVSVKLVDKVVGAVDVQGRIKVSDNVTLVLFECVP